MRILSLIHQEDAPTGVFAEVIRDEGHELEEASLALDRPPARAAHEYDAALVMGGGMHVDQDDRHPWLGDERALIADLLRRERPLMGVCLGSQLVAQVAGADVGPLGGGPEIGWHEVELLAAAASDPVMRALPPRFSAFEWHSYGAGPPPDSTALAQSPAGLQAYRLDGAPAWGIQFHAELLPATLAGWLDSYGRDDDAREAGVDPERLREQNARAIARWNELGRCVCSAFVAACDGKRRAA